MNDDKELIPAAFAQNLMSELTPREAKILRMRFGIDMDRHAVEDVAKQFDITPDEVCDIETNALRMLRGKPGLTSVH